MQTQRKPDNPNADGRTLRSERSRQKIVDALFELVGEGRPMPTAKQVAERANLGIRTVFRHFDDMDTLFEQVNQRLRREVIDALPSDPPEQPPRARLEALVERRCAFFERVSPYWKGTQAQRSRSAFLTELHQSESPQLRSQLFNWLPEFRSLPNEVVDAVELMLSPAAWNRLRSDQKLSVKRATAAVHRAVFALCDEELEALD